MAKLGKMKMPKQRRKDEMDMDLEGMEMALEEEPSEEMPESEEPMEMAEEGEEELELSEPGPLEDLSDDELLAEVKKRGLMAQLEGGESPEQEEELLA